MVFLKRPGGSVTGIYNTRVYSSFPLNWKVPRRMQPAQSPCQRSCPRFSMSHTPVSDIARKIPRSFLLYMSYLSSTCAFRTRRKLFCVSCTIEWDETCSVSAKSVRISIVAFASFSLLLSLRFSLSAYIIFYVSMGMHLFGRNI